MRGVECVSTYRWIIWSYDSTQQISKYATPNVYDACPEPSQVSFQITKKCKVKENCWNDLENPVGGNRTQPHQITHTNSTPTATPSDTPSDTNPECKNKAIQSL